MFRLWLTEWARSLGERIDDNRRRRGLHRSKISRQQRTEPLQIEELEGRRMLTLLGQQVFPADNPWNQNISNVPVAANSAAIISQIGTSIHLHPDWGEDSTANRSDPLYGIPYNVVHGNSTAKINVTIDNYPGESDVAAVPIPSNAVIEGDFQNGPNPNGGGYEDGERGDSHLIVWDEDNNIAYELFGVTRPSDPTLFPNTSGVEKAHTDGKWHAAQETIWNMNTNTFRTLGFTSADAAGLSILAGLVRPDEGLPTAQGGQGAITHALRVTLPSRDINPQYIYPASHMVNTSQGTNNVPLGARLRLANTPAINSLISSMPPESQIIARAMQQYGLFVADIGSSMYVTGASASENANGSINQVWNMDDILASNGLRELTAGDFEVVNLKPVVTGLSASQGAAGSVLTITGQNFSGAAGHLSVFFGGTVASSVTLVSDTQLSVVVPRVSGTVDVTVQSGVSETDNNSDNPNANVNKPIFGYGVSATTSADSFTELNAGDFNLDGHVNAADIGPAMQALTNPTAYETQYHVTAATLQALGDVNGDGQLTIADLQRLLSLLKSGGGSTDNTGNGSSIAAEQSGSGTSDTVAATGDGAAFQKNLTIPQTPVVGLSDDLTTHSLRTSVVMAASEGSRAFSIQRMQEVEFESLYVGPWLKRPKKNAQNDHLESGGTVQSGWSVSFSAEGPEM
jgi:hypothetical protein